MNLKRRCKIIKVDQAVPQKQNEGEYIIILSPSLKWQAMPVLIRAGSGTVVTALAAC